MDDDAGRRRQTADETELRPMSRPGISRIERIGRFSRRKWVLPVSTTRRV